MSQILSGTTRALMDEYEKAIDELVLVIRSLDGEQLVFIRDQKTRDLQCRSIQSILVHVIDSGHGYTGYIQKQLGLQYERPPAVYFTTGEKFAIALYEMFLACKTFFLDHPGLDLEEMDESKKILTNWGQRYDIEQLMEHAIVHVLKHRLQIEHFLKNG